MARRPTPPTRRGYEVLDLYTILGVHAGSTATEIKRAYRERVLRCHPDMDPSPNAAEAFRKVHQAYRILSDPAQRFLFEQHGHVEPGKPKQHRERPFVHARSKPRGWTDMEPDRPPTRRGDDAIDPWLFKGLHITGLLFGVGCVGGISTGYLFGEWPPYMLVFMLPGLMVLPDCWAVLFARSKSAR